MRIPILILISILLITAAPCLASYSDDDVLGFYFDEGAESNCLETAPYVTVPMHLVLTNPAMGTIGGYEFGYSVTGNYMVSGISFKGTSPMDLGGHQGNHIVGLASPITPSGATVLATLSVFVMDNKQIKFDLHGAAPASIPDHPELPVLLVDDDILKNPVLSSPLGHPNARINGQCNAEAEDGSWDSVKSLYQ